MNTIAYFEIQADDTQRAIKFYNTVFGWEFTKQEGMPIDYWTIKTDDISGGLLERPVAAHMGGTNAFCNSVWVEDFDATAEKILANGGRVAMDKFAVPGKCWQGYFLDPENNTFGIFQPDESAA